MSLAAQILPITSTMTLPLAFSQNIAHDHVKPTVRGPPCWLQKKWIEIAVAERTSLRLSVYVQIHAMSCLSSRQLASWNQTSLRILLARSSTIVVVIGLPPAKMWTEPFPKPSYAVFLLQHPCEHSCDWKSIVAGAKAGYFNTPQKIPTLGRLWTLLKQDSKSQPKLACESACAFIRRRAT